MLKNGTGKFVDPDLAVAHSSGHPCHMTWTDGPPEDDGHLSAGASFHGKAPAPGRHGNEGRQPRKRCVY